MLFLFILFFTEMKKRILDNKKMMKMIQKFHMKNSQLLLLQLLMLWMMMMVNLKPQVIMSLDQQMLITNGCFSKIKLFFPFLEYQFFLSLIFHSYQINFKMHILVISRHFVFIIIFITKFSVIDVYCLLRHKKKTLGQKDYFSLLILQKILFWFIVILP